VMSAEDDERSKPDPHRPSAMRVMLGAELRRLREERGLSRLAAARAIHAPESTITRLELGRAVADHETVDVLLTLYDVEDPRAREAYLTILEHGNAPGWWREYRAALPSWFEAYVGLEQSATHIRTYQARFVPALFQTRAYARAVTRFGKLDEDPEIEQWVELRMARQALLDQDDPPKVWVVLDEALLRRPVGSRAVMREQIDRLLEYAERPNVTLLILPFNVGGHGAGAGSFTVLRLAHRDVRELVYLEQLTTSVYLDDREDVEGYKRVLDRMAADALSAQETKAMLRQLRDFDGDPPV